MTYRLYKYERLCSRTAINNLFAGGRGLVAYPLRAVVSVKPCKDEKAGVHFMITVPKKKIRKAVGRVLLRRRIREAYRLLRPLLVPQIETLGCRVDVAFIYLDKDIVDYAKVSNCMVTLLGKIALLAVNTIKSNSENKNEGQGDAIDS